MPTKQSPTSELEIASQKPLAMTTAAEQFPALTIEVTLYAALALVGLFVRLFVLGEAPLNADEARQAVASWNFVRGTPDDFTGSPLLFTGNALLFALFGATDVAARLLPALSGSALILLPALLRRELGRTGALIAGALLVFSPTLVLFSRQANGAIIATTCALAALAFAWRYFTDSNTCALYLASASAALALLAAREAWTFVLFAVLVVLASRLDLLSLLGNRQSAIGNRKPLVLFAIVFLAVATTFLLHRDGIGAALDLFGAWLDGLRPGASLFDPLNLLLVYEPLIFFFGVAALVGLGFSAQSLQREQAPLVIFAFLPIIAFLLYSFGMDKNPARVVVLVVPLALFAGWHIGAWLTRLVDEMREDPNAKAWLLTQELPVVLLAGALVAFLYLLVVEFVTRGDILAATVIALLKLEVESTAAWSGAAIAALGLLAFATVAFVTVATVGWARAKEVGLAVVLACLAAWTIRQSVMLSFGGLFPGDVNVGLNVRELSIPRAASPNARDLVSTLEDASRWRANDAHSLMVVADASLGSLVEWNLRDFRYARFGERPIVTQDTQALLLPANASAPATGWISQRFRLENVRIAAPSPNLLRWLVFRDVGSAEFVDVVLWVPRVQ